MDQLTTDEYYKQSTDTYFTACGIIEDLRKDGFSNEAMIAGLFEAAISIAAKDRALFLAELERFMGSYSYDISIKLNPRR